MYFSKETVERAVSQLRGTANHLFKIWLCFKKMGLTENNSILVNTSNPTDSLNCLFHSGATDGSFFIPFASTKRYFTMKSDAARSIIQTTAKRWADSGSVVTCDPTKFLSFDMTASGDIRVSTTKSYPLGLGFGPNGFANGEDQKVEVPLKALAVWAYAQKDVDPSSFVNCFLLEMNISAGERAAVFGNGDLEVVTSSSPLSDADLWSICEKAMQDEKELIVDHPISENEYLRSLKSMVTINNKPKWINADPSSLLKKAIEQGEKSIVLYGAPRTGKTRAIDELFSRESGDRMTLQMHEGWNYSNLIVGLQPKENSDGFAWKIGPLFDAIKSDKKVIVLEEANRTNLSQALGEVFSLLEKKYRGKENKIQLPNGEYFSIDENVLIIFTLNTLDNSTVDLDDALFGRIAAIEFPPRIESLNEILDGNKISAETKEKISNLFNFINGFYPLGHGYFADYKPEQDFKFFYLTKIRPVLVNHFNETEPERIESVDNLVDQSFN